MLAFILLLQWVLSVNLITQMEYTCKEVGKDLVTCSQTDKCKFYKISDRETWDLDTNLEVAMKSPDGESFSWYNGNITFIFGDQLRLSITDCNDETSEIPCETTVNRFSFQLRQVPYTEFVGMRVDVWRTYFNRWIPTNLTAIQADDWSDLWAYGGEFGNIVGLQPFDLMASDQQDCQLDPTEIDPLASELAANADQVPAAVQCTKIAEESLCSDDHPATALNCEWSSELSTCFLNNVTNDLLACYQNYGMQETCEDEESHPDLKCKWLVGELSDEADSLCINSSSALSIMAFVLIMLFLF